MTTFSPPACSSATCAQTRSSTSLRSAPSSPATIDEPNLATTVMALRVRRHPASPSTAATNPAAGSTGIELEFDVSHDHLVAGLETRPAKLGDHADLAQPSL